MLKPAQLYREELNKKYIETWYDPKYQYYFCGTDRYELQIPDNTENGKFNFVCVDKDNNVTGYFSYWVDWQSLSVSNFGLMSFADNNVEFIREVINHIVDLFAFHNINRIDFWCFKDNPANEGYAKLVKRFGGKQVGELHQVSCLLDGQLHDTVSYEIMQNTELAVHMLKRRLKKLLD